MSTVSDNLYVESPMNFINFGFLVAIRLSSMTLAIKIKSLLTIGNSKVGLISFHYFGPFLDKYLYARHTDQTEKPTHHLGAPSSAQLQFDSPILHAWACTNEHYFAGP